MARGCGCNGNKSTALMPRWKWTSADGQQVVTGLTEVRAKTRENQYGGTAEPE